MPIYFYFTIPSCISQAGTNLSQSVSAQLKRKSKSSGQDAVTRLEFSSRTMNGSRYHSDLPPGDEGSCSGDDGFVMDDYEEDDEVMTDDYFRVAQDPFQCTLQIYARKGSGDALKKLFGPLLEGIDPTFQFVSVHESEEPDTKLRPIWREKAHEESANFTECQAVSIVLFLHEAFGRLSAVSVQKNFRHSPWKLHHRLELPYNVKPRITASQEFYQTLPDLPLWSVCPVHYGNEHLRFHIFVRNFPQMKAFYEGLTGKEAVVHGSPGFCYFPIYTQRGLDIQLSLKHLPQIHARPSSTVRLKLRITDLNSVASHLVGCPTPCGERTWLTSDPDGNIIILEETAEPHDCSRKQRLLSGASLETSDYETASTETDSLAGNACYSPRSPLRFPHLDEILII